MKCHCCDRELPLLRHVQLRGGPTAVPPGGFRAPDDPAYIRYREEHTYRSAFVCPACYDVLDSVTGMGEIGGRVYNIAGRSRGRKAPLYNQVKYDAFMRRKAREMGIDLD